MILIRQGQAIGKKYFITSHLMDGNEEKLDAKKKYLGKDCS